MQQPGSDAGPFYLIAPRCAEPLRRFEIAGLARHLEIHRVAASCFAPEEVSAS